MPYVAHLILHNSLFLDGRSAGELERMEAEEREKTGAVSDAEAQPDAQVSECTVLTFFVFAFVKVCNVMRCVRL